MHESALVTDLVHKVEDLAESHGNRRVVGVQVELGQFTAIMPDHLRDHFAHAAAGTRAEGAHLDITLHTHPTDPLAYALTLAGIEIEATETPA
jgi:hydrogenase nickel incorporation protein HypA/HybF